MSGLASALYVGVVGHTRLSPRRHALRYRIFMLLLDLDDAPELARRLRWFSLDRFNLLSFHAKDHGDGSGEPLRAQVERHLKAADVDFDGGPIRLLCLPRVLGFVFNPISVYYCHRRDGTLAAVLYEVSSTFGERHSYLIPVPSAEAGREIRHSADKRLHVSPFMDMGLRYDFRLTPPGDRLRLVIDAFPSVSSPSVSPVDDRMEETPILNASFVGRRRALSDAAVLAAWAAHPLLTLKIVGAIHFEALKIWLKGVKLRSGTPAPAAPVSLGRAYAGGCPMAQVERR